MLKTGLIRTMARALRITPSAAAKGRVPERAFRAQFSGATNLNGSPAVSERFRQQGTQTIARGLQFDLSAVGRPPKSSGAAVYEGAAFSAAPVPTLAGIKTLARVDSLLELKSAHERVAVARREYEESLSNASDIDEDPEYDFEDGLSQWAELENATADYWQALKANVAGPDGQPRRSSKRPAPQPPSASPQTHAARQLRQAREQLHQAREAFQNVGRAGGAARTPAGGFQQDLNEVREKWAAVKEAEQTYRTLTGTVGRGN